MLKVDDFFMFNIVYGIFLHFYFASSVLYLIHIFINYLIFNFGSFLPKDAYVNLIDLLESFRTSIYYLVAEIVFDTAENETSKVCQELDSEID